MSFKAVAQNNEALLKVQAFLFVNEKLSFIFLIVLYLDDYLEVQ